jgi:uncharacterized protein (TIGR01777 family)
MEVFISGGTGFVGRALCQRLLDEGHQVTVLSRSAAAAQSLPRGVGAAIGDPTREGPWQEEVANCQAVINLAGASIFGRWTREYKELLIRSRVLTTRNLVWALPDVREQAPVFISASGVGYYGSPGDQELDESSPPGDDFLSRLSQEWEAEAQAADAKGARVVRTRFGMVLGGGGGALEQMLPVYRRGLGGPLGNGRQWFSWVHRADLVDAILFCLQQEELTGAVNLTAPQPVRNAEFSKELGRALGRPAFIRTPGAILRLVLGELGSVLLSGQRVIPKALLDAGYEFRFPELAAALKDLLHDKA